MIDSVQKTKARRLRVFLCHASEDKPVVRRIYEQLRAYNIEVWFDECDLLPGERWEAIIPEVLRRCDLVIICLSHTLLLKEGYAHYEVHIVLETVKKKPPEALYLIPLLLDDCQMPAYLQSWHYVSNAVTGYFEKIIGSCEKRRVWLNMHLQEHIEPLRQDPASSPSPDVATPVEPAPGPGLSTSDDALYQPPEVPVLRAGSAVRLHNQAVREQGTCLYRYTAHAGWVLAVAWEPGGTRVASTGADGTVRIWEATTGHALLTYHGHTHLLNRINMQAKIYALAWSPDGRYVASAGDGAHVHIWQTQTGQLLRRYEGHHGLWPAVYTLAWVPASQEIASACSHTLGGDKTIHVWHTLTGQLLNSYDAQYHKKPEFFLYALAWSADGQRLAAACGDRILRIWQRGSEKSVAHYRSGTKPATHLAWSPDSRTLASAHPDHTVQLWNTQTGAAIRTCYGHTATVRQVAWSPDGRFLATASNDRTVQLWDAQTATRLYTYRGHAAWVTSVAWSPDGELIASASNDGTVQIWQA
jgi:WD40 repeat protein